MSSHRFFVSKSGFDGNQVRLEPDQAHQVCHVLRLKAGAGVVVLDGAGYEYDVTLTTVSKREVLGQITDKRPALGESKVQITLFQSLLSREKFEWVLQKGTEVGVCRFVPVATARSIVRAKQIDEKKLTRWRKIVTEAAEQSHRGRIPEIVPPVDWSQAVGHLDRVDQALLAVPGPESGSLREALNRPDEAPKSVAILIGPEGGFTAEEVDAASRQGATRISLGRRILRTETAGTTLAVLVLYELGQLEPGKE